MNGWAQYLRDESSGLADAKVSARKNYVGITLLGKPGTDVQFRQRLTAPAMFKNPTISINQFNMDLSTPENPTGNLIYNCKKSKTGIKFDQDTQTVQINTQFPNKLDMEWLNQNFKFFNDAERQKIIKRELSPVLIVIKSKITKEDTESTGKSRS